MRVDPGSNPQPSPPYLIDYKGFFSLFDFQPTKSHTIESVSRAFPSALELDCLDRAKLRWAGEPVGSFSVLPPTDRLRPHPRSSHSLSENTFFLFYAA